MIDSDSDVERVVPSGIKQEMKQEIKQEPDAPLTQADYDFLANPPAFANQDQDEEEGEEDEEEEEESEEEDEESEEEEDEEEEEEDGTEDDEDEVPASVPAASSAPKRCLTTSSQKSAASSAPKGCLPTPSEKFYCRQGHELFLTDSAPGTWKGKPFTYKVTCDVCSRQVSGSTWRCQAVQCDWDVCLECHSGKRMRR